MTYRESPYCSLEMQQKRGVPGGRPTAIVPPVTPQIAAPEIQSVTVHAHQPEVLGAGDHDPFTRPRPDGIADYLPDNFVVPTRIEHTQGWGNFQNAWSKLKTQCQPQPGRGNPEAHEAALERFHDAYGYQFDRHGRMKFP